VNAALSENSFTGRLPLRMKEMTKLEKLYVNVKTLSGPLPKLYTAPSLVKCDLAEGDYCRDWDVPSSLVHPECKFKPVPKCNSDCMVLYEWIEINPVRCCIDPGISCDQEGRIITM
jgi:hypothetical protein